MILKTNYKRCGAKALVEYASRRRNFDVRARDGHLMSDEEIDRFLEKSEERKFTRKFMISPQNREIPLDSMDQYTRNGMDRWLKERDRKSVEYVYSIHYDTERPHAHVAITGKQRDLKIKGREQIEKTKDVFREEFKERELEKELQNVLNKEKEKEKELDMERGL